MQKIKLIISTVTFAMIALAAMSTAYAAPTTLRVSTSSSGREANDGSGASSISANGLVVTFESYASNLVQGDRNGGSDVFVRNLSTGQIKRISNNATEAARGEGIISTPSISATGRYIAYSSVAREVADDRNGLYDIYVYDQQTAKRKRVSLSTIGVASNDHCFYPKISANGRYVVFESYASNLIPNDTNGVKDVFLRDLVTNVTKRLSQGINGAEANADSSAASISADGRFVAFQSDANDIVVGDTNSFPEVFVHDVVNGVAERIAVSNAGLDVNGVSLSPSISGDGRYVAFMSNATNLVTGDTNGSFDIFAYDRLNRVTKRVSVNSEGFESGIFSGSFSPNISADGRYIGFVSTADNLVSGDTNGVFDAFVHDQQTGMTQRLSVNNDGGEGDFDSLAPSLSADGHSVAYTSAATNLVVGDLNNTNDVFLRKR